MISPEEAIEKIQKAVPHLPSENRLLSKAFGFVLAEDIYAPIDLPSFRQSAMDGYAFHFTSGKMTYDVVGEVAAGSSENPDLKEGQGVRIFTGAMVPDKANIVVQQEIVSRSEGQATIEESVMAGKNIRPVGEQIRKGDLALKKGTILSPAAIGFLAGLGIVEVAVFRKPRIALITTGNELVQPGEHIAPGQIYESNSLMLCAALESFQFSNFQVVSIKDDYQATKERIKEAISETDLVLLTGGISVGDYDFVGKALNEIGVDELFYKIKQKPGKPVYMGRHDEALITALPGNPAAALTCFYIYVLPALNQMCGKPFQGLEKGMMVLADSYVKKGSRAEYLKAKINENEVAVLGQQSSAMLSSFAAADALIYLPAEKATVDQGEKVVVYKFSPNE